MDFLSFCICNISFEVGKNEKYLDVENPKNDRGLRTEPVPCEDYIRGQLSVNAMYPGTTMRA